MTTEKAKVPPTFLTKAYLSPLENKTYGLFRDLVVETEERDDEGKPVREKLKRIGPIRVLREAERGEEQQVKIRTSSPDGSRMLELVEIQGQ